MTFGRIHKRGIIIGFLAQVESVRGASWHGMMVEEVVSRTRERVQALGSGALAALLVAAKRYHINADPGVLRHHLGIGGRPPESADLVKAASFIGMKARIVKGGDIDALRSAPRPVIIRFADNSYGVLVKTSIGLPGIITSPESKPEIVNWDTFELQWSREFIIVAPDTDLRSANVQGRSFGLRWFSDAVWRYRRPLASVIVASLFVQLFSLLTPLLFQLVIDHVLLHKSTSTLAVVGIALVVISIFDATLQYMRTYILSHTTSRIDVELGARLYGHLFKLPLSYFNTRPVGQTISRVREVENIRNFLTGQGLTAILDIPYSILFFGVLTLYSWSLTLIVALAIPCYVGLVLLIGPILREKIREKFRYSSMSQQYLVETVVGAPTIKSAAIEPIIQRRWEEKLAAYVKVAFDTAMLGSAGQNLIQLVSKITTAAILFFGAEAAMRGELTIGALVAFNMIASQLTQPVLRLANFFQELQQTQISIERVGDIMNAPIEATPEATLALPAIKGQIDVSGVSFRYPQSGRDVIQGISLTIEAGEVIGIVGASGSGKSTFASLVTRLQMPQEGKILIDGVDIAHAHPAWLRRQIGTVLQENFLFNDTVHGNISLANPSASRAEVVRAASIAGADEFIRGLPHGYDSVIEERGTNLSGGQRQRIAIARALIGKPRILIFDEATSALDYESERAIQGNMGQISRGRTVIIIAHRLAAVRDCDRILSMERGKIVEEGTHSELLGNSDGIYAHLWALQQSASL